MHAGDLGTFQDAVGSLFWLEITHRPLYRNRARGLAALNRDLNLYYGAHQDENLTRVTPLSLSQILAKTPPYPHLKAKAAQTRHLAEFCLTLARRHRFGDATRAPFVFGQRHRLSEQSVQHGDLLIALFEGLLAYHQSCAASPFSVDNCKSAMYRYLQSLEALNAMWRAGVPLELQASLPFHLRPKAHLCQHLVEDKIQAYGSPSGFWCYRDEDFIGACKTIAHKTMHPATLEVKMLQKLRILAALGSDALTA
jgi:hypothetical protein